MTASPSPIPSPTPVTVWTADLSVPVGNAGGPGDAVLLSPGERERAARFRQPLHARRFVRRRALLRRVLAAELGVAPGAVELAVGAHGRPEITTTGADVPRFSASSSGDVAVLAVTRGRAVGVDVERLRDHDGAGAVMRLAFSADELDAVRELAARDPRAATAAFFAGWTAKEACAKCDGRGLAALTVRALGPALDPDGPPRVVATQGDAGPWLLLRPRVQGSVVALALAGAEPPAQVEVRAWEAEGRGRASG